MRKYGVSVLLIILMILITGCARSSRDQPASGVHTSDDISLESIPSVCDIEDTSEPAEENSSDTESLTSFSESESTEVPTTTPEVTTTPEPTTTPATTTTPESTTAATTTTKSTTGIWTIN